MSSGGFREKIEALDLIINVLKEHEKKLDELANELAKILTEVQQREVKAEPKVTVEAIPQTRIICSEWADFKEKSRNANLVVFNVDEKELQIVSMLNNVTYKYSEPLGEFKLRLSKEDGRYSIDSEDINALIENVGRKKLKCGLEASINIEIVPLHDTVDILYFKFHLGSNLLKDWISRELNIPTDRIIKGKIGE